MSNKDNKNDRYKLSKDRLLRSEYDHYRQIGEPDYSQNWLEIFTPVIISDLFSIMESCSDNTQKAEYIQNELGLYGFEELGLGTNVYAMWHPAYPGVAFKVALDTAGLADNYNDEVLYNLVNQILADAGKKPRYTKCLMRHPTGIVSVQERKVLVKTQDRMDTFRGSILKSLQILSEHFLIVDMSPTLFQFNYGIERNGDWCFIDASDLYPLDSIRGKLCCSKAIGSNKVTGGIKRCGGMLRYTEDFSAIVCDRCGKEYIPSEFRPNDKKEVSSMANAHMDGLSQKEREFMQAEELAAISKGAYAALKGGQASVLPVQPIAAPDDEDEEESLAAKYQTFVAPQDPDDNEDPSAAMINASDGRQAEPVVNPISSKDQIILSSKMIVDEKERYRVLVEAGIELDTIARLCPNYVMQMSGPVTPPPPVQRRSSVFWDPKGPKPNLMDRSGGVEHIRPGGSIEPTIPEPSVEQIRAMSTAFTPVTSVGDDDEDGDDEGSVEPVNTGAASPEPIQKITCSVIDTDDNTNGLLICIPPDYDFDSLYEDQAPDIWVSNDGGTTRGLAIQASALRKLIEQAYEDLSE